jgi:hypothetical protein
MELLIEETLKMPTFEQLTKTLGSESKARFVLAVEAGEISGDVIDEQPGVKVKDIPTEDIEIPEEPAETKEKDPDDPFNWD